MEILYYCKEKEILMDKWQRYHIFDELEKHGCMITVFNPLQYENISKANSSLIKHLNKKKYNLFMTPHGSQDIFIETLLMIKRMKIPTLLICFDNLIVPFKHKDIAKHFDLVWLTSRETDKMFKRWGANTIFNQYAANPYFFCPKYTNEINRIAFIGTPYGSRVNMINLLLKNEINVSLYSRNNNKINIKNNKSFKDYIKTIYNLSRFSIGRSVLKGAFVQKISKKIEINRTSMNLQQFEPVGLEKLSELYSNYALSLSSTAARNTGVLKSPVNIVNLRSFEIPMCGGLQICSYSEEISEYFEEDKEIILYRSKGEFIDKAMFYLKPENHDIRMKMKIAARKRAVNDHTWFNRFKKVFDYFGLMIGMILLLFKEY